MAAILFFKLKSKIFPWHLVTGKSIVWKFGEADYDNCSRKGFRGQEWKVHGGHFVFQKGRQNLFIGIVSQAITLCESLVKLPIIVCTRKGFRGQEWKVYGGHFVFLKGLKNLFIGILSQLKTFSESLVMLPIIVCTREGLKLKGYGGHFVFEIEAINSHWHLAISIKIG